MTIKIIPVLAAAIFMVYARPAAAHLPRWSMDDTRIDVRDPESSQFYYGELRGSEDVFIIDSNRPFDLYLKIITPEIRNRRTDFIISVTPESRIYRDEIVFPAIHTISTSQQDWTRQREFFIQTANYSGPEWSADLGADRYAIRVSNPGNQGKYGLVIGSKEEWSFTEYIKTLFLLPKINSHYYERSIFWCLASPMYLPFIFALAILIAWQVRKKRLRNNQFDKKS